MKRKTSKPRKAARRKSTYYSLTHPAVQAVGCPHVSCLASVGTPCSSNGRGTHKKRVELYEAKTRPQGKEVPSPETGTTNGAGVTNTTGTSGD